MMKRKINKKAHTWTKFFKIASLIHFSQCYRYIVGQKYLHFYANTVKSRFKERNLVTKMKFHIKKSQLSIKSQFKEWKGADRPHSLNRDFTVLA